MTNLQDFIDKVEYSWDGTPHNSSSRAVYSRGQEFVNLAKNPKGVGATGMVPNTLSRWTVEKNKDVPQPHPLGITKGFITYPLDSDEYGVSIYNVDGYFQQTAPYRNASIWVYTFVSNAEARLGGPTEPFTNVPYMTWFKLKNTITLPPATPSLLFYLRSKDGETEASTYSTGIMVWEDGTEEPPGYFDGDSPTEVFGVLPWTPQTKWHQSEDQVAEYGIDRGVLYLSNDVVVPWNGLVRVSENIDGVDIEPYYVDGVKRLDVPSTFEIEGEIEAYSAPKQFAAYVGEAEIAPGFYGSNQMPRPFSISYRTRVTTVNGKQHYKIHILYNVLAQPADREYSTVGEAPEPTVFTWEFKATPQAVGGIRSSLFTIDSREISPVALATIESRLYGYDQDEPEILTPDEIAAVIADYPL